MIGVRRCLTGLRVLEVRLHTLQASLRSFEIMVALLQDRAVFACRPGLSFRLQVAGLRCFEHALRCFRLSRAARLWHTISVCWSRLRGLRLGIRMIRDCFHVAVQVTRFSYWASYGLRRVSQFQRWAAWLWRLAWGGGVLLEPKFGF